MVSVKIGPNERTLDQVDESWVNQEIHRYSLHGQSACIRVRIDVPGARAVFSTPSCASDGTTRPPTSVERRIHTLWQKYRLDTSECVGTNVMGFLHELTQIL